MAEKKRGTLRVWDDSRAHGWMVCDDGGRPVFVDLDSFAGVAPCVGLRATFDVLLGQRGLRAENIEVLDLVTLPEVRT